MLVLYLIAWILLGLLGLGFARRAPNYSKDRLKRKEALVLILLGAVTVIFAFIYITGDWWDEEI